MLYSAVVRYADLSSVTSYVVGSGPDRRRTTEKKLASDLVLHYVFPIFGDAFRCSCIQCVVSFPLQ